MWLLTTRDVKSQSKRKGCVRIVTQQLIDNNWSTKFQQLLREDKEVSLNTKWAIFNCLIEIGDRSYLLKVNEGDIKLINDPTIKDSWDFAIRGNADVWQRYADGDKDPEYRDILAMVFQGKMSITGNIKSHIIMEGNYQKLFANLQPLYTIISKIQETKEVA
jgi:hypothetical protein